MTPRSRIDRPRSPPTRSERLSTKCDEEAADQRRRVQLERQVHAEREDQRRHAEHLHGDGDHRAGAEEDVGDRLPAHEPFDQRLHDRGLRRGEHRRAVSPGAASPNWKRLRQHARWSRPTATASRDHAEELHLLLRRRRRAEPVAGLQVGDGLARHRERGADHARDRHDEEHARSCPRAPNCSSTTDEMMIVSMVMPETGLRAVVAMALAATEVKKNEKSSVSSEARSGRTAAPAPRLPKKIADGRARRDDHADQDRHDRACRGRCAPARAPRRAGTRAPRSRTSRRRSRSDLMMPKMPAVAIAPTPMKRT